MRVVGGRLRGRPLAAPQVESDPSDRRPAARVGVQHSHPCLRRSDFRRARARSLRRHRRARHRSGLARRGLHAIRRRRRGGARADPRKRRRARAWRQCRASSAATPPSSASSIRSSRSRSPSSIRPMAKTSPKRRSPRRATGGWFAPDALIVVEEATKARFVAPEGFSEIERRGYDDTEFIFLRFNSA